MLLRLAHTCTWRLPHTPQCRASSPQGGLALHSHTSRPGSCCLLSLESAPSGSPRTLWDPRVPPLLTHASNFPEDSVTGPRSHKKSVAAEPVLEPRLWGRGGAGGTPSPAVPKSVRTFTEPARRLFVCFPNKHLLHPRQAARCWGPSHERGQTRSAHSPEKQTDAKQVITSMMDATEEKQREPWEGTGGSRQFPPFVSGLLQPCPRGLLQPLAPEPPGKAGAG